LGDPTCNYGHGIYQQVRSSATIPCDLFYETNAKQTFHATNPAIFAPENNIILAPTCLELSLLTHSKAMMSQSSPAFCNRSMKPPIAPPFPLINAHPLHQTRPSDARAKRPKRTTSQMIHSDDLTATHRVAL
jgi:hypothetical protein